VHSPSNHLPSHKDQQCDEQDDEKGQLLCGIQVPLHTDLYWVRDADLTVLIEMYSAGLGVPVNSDPYV
jgi:hypothetical protein